MSPAMPLDSASTLLTAGTVAALCVVAEHPALARLWCAVTPVAVGAGLWWWPGSWPAWAVLGVGAALLGGGAARNAFVEMADTRRVRPPRWVRIGRWVGTTVFVAAAVGVAFGTPVVEEIRAQPWLALGAVVALVAVAYLLAGKVVVYLLGPWRARPWVEREVRLRTYFVLEAGSGRGKRWHHCIELHDDPTVWRVSWWRLGRMVTRPGTYSATVVLTGAGLLAVRRITRVVDPAPDTFVCSADGAADAGTSRPAGQVPWPIGPAARAVGLLVGAVATMACFCGAVAWCVTRDGVSPSVALLVALVATILVAVLIALVRTNRRDAMPVRTLRDVQFVGATKTGAECGSWPENGSEFPQP